MIRLLLSELCVVCVRPVAFRICFRMSHDHRYMASYRHYLIYLLGPDPTTQEKMRQDEKQPYYIHGLIATRYDDAVALSAKLQPDCR